MEINIMMSKFVYDEHILARYFLHNFG